LEFKYCLLHLWKIEIVLDRNFQWGSKKGGEPEKNRNIASLHATALGRFSDFSEKTLRAMVWDRPLGADSHLVGRSFGRNLPPELWGCGLPLTSGVGYSICVKVSPWIVKS
jgi:hypothetical protein